MPGLTAVDPLEDLRLPYDALGEPLPTIEIALRWLATHRPDEVPETVVQLRLGLPVFTRASEFERTPVCYDEAIGVWLDDFGASWYTPADIRGFLADGKQVCVVSPELHGRDPAPLWRTLRLNGLAGAPALMLCTDFPERASAFFGTGR